jgi:hypothetical protein
MKDQVIARPLSPSQYNNKNANKTFIQQVGYKSGNGFVAQCALQTAWALESDITMYIIITLSIYIAIKPIKDNHCKKRGLLLLT